MMFWVAIIIYLIGAVAWSALTEAFLPLLAPIWPVMVLVLLHERLSR